MDLNHYQKESQKTAVYPTKIPQIEVWSEDANDYTSSALLYPVLGLAGEAGEIVEKVKKIIRDKAGYVDGEMRQKLLQESGDVLWYLARVVEELGETLEYVAALNLAKLRDRQERKVLHGAGDSR